MSTLTDEQIIEDLDEKYHKPIEEFIKMYEATIELDPNFFYFLYRIPDTIRNIVNYYQEADNNQDEKTTFKLTQITTDMDLIDSLSEETKQYLAEEFKNKELEERMDKIDDIEILVLVIGKDLEIYNEIELVLLPGEYIPKGNYDPNHRFFFQLSLNKFTNSCPELFQDDRFFKNSKKLKRTYRLESIDNKRRN